MARKRLVLKSNSNDLHQRLESKRSAIERERRHHHSTKPSRKPSARTSAKKR